MKKFLLSIALFSLPLIIFIGGIEVGLRNIPNDYAYKNDWLEHNIQNVQILSLGSSHGYLAIRPEYLDLRAFNAAHVSQSINYDAFILQKYIDRADSLRLVIWPISYFSLPSTLETTGEWWRAKGYYIYYDCPYHPMEVRYHSALMGTNLKSNIERVVSFISLNGYSEIMCDSLGWQVGNTKENRLPNWYMNWEERVRRHTYDVRANSAIIENNKCTIESVLRLCEEKSIKVLLLTTPVCSTYSSHVEYEQLNLMMQFCDSVASEYSNATYLNMFNDVRFTEDDFFDSDHLESEGAIKFTKILNDFIMQNVLN